MRRAPLPPLLAATLLLLATPLTPLQAQEDGIPTGTVPPTVTLHDLEGAPYDFADVQGEKPVLVEFWATWCAVCQALDPVLQEAHQRFGKDVEFLVVAVGVAQTPQQIRAHVQRHPPAGRLLWDEQGEAVRAFQAPGTGYIVVLDPNGAVAYTGTGPDQDISGVLRRILND